MLFELGRGGTARVYLAVLEGPSGFQRLSVLKALKTELATNVEFHDMLFNEARLMSRLGHGNIVQVHEVVEHEGAPVIAMEHLAGKSLYEVRTRAPQLLPCDTQIYIVSRVLAGLHYAHELTDYDGTPLEVVHRDVTPQNVFLTYDGQVKVLDFGIAKLAGSLVETRVGVVKGKVRYMAPEQLQGLPLDGRTDVFACGVMLWEGITGHRLWGEMTDVEVVSAVLDAAVPSPRLFVPRMDPVLERICMKALAHDRAERYANADGLREALDDYLSRRDVRMTSYELGRALSTAFASDREVFARAVEERLGYASLLRNSPPPRAPSVNPSPPISERKPLRESAPPKPTRGSSASSARGEPSTLAREPGPAATPWADWLVSATGPRHRLWVWLLVAAFVAVCGYLLVWQPPRP